jgi:hypothetical protein
MEVHLLQWGQSVSFMVVSSLSLKFMLFRTLSLNLITLNGVYKSNTTYLDSQVCSDIIVC